MSDLVYLSGFGNAFESAAEARSLPVGQNNPQQAPQGLYAEQLSGTAFTAPNHENQRSWLYRILPSVALSNYRPLAQPLLATAPITNVPHSPDPLRWNPLPVPTQATDFIAGLRTVCANGDAATRSGCAVHLYSANQSMSQRCFYNADGDLLIVPQDGGLRLITEFGLIDVEPQEIAVIQRGIKFQVELTGDVARGYVCENYGEHFQLPYRGPIGANGLANARDFLTPVAWYEQGARVTEVVAKYDGRLWKADCKHSPFNVVAWHGNYAPYKYDLRRFNAMNSVSYDHPDPSIFTVLTSPTAVVGTANIDFVIFPPRWMVAERTFRPPYFHRNVMSEYMGLIHGVYDAKPSGGFMPGGGSLHNCMSPHGPDVGAFDQASRAELRPVYLANTMAFMFETASLLRPTAYALNTELLQHDYVATCWGQYKPHFRPGQI